MVNPYELSLGLSGIVLFGAMIYYNIVTLKHIWENDAITARTVFLHPDISLAFKAFIWGIVSFSVGQMLLAYGIMAENQTAQNIEDIFSIAFFFGYFYFFRETAKLSRPDQE